MGRGLRIRVLVLGLLSGAAPLFAQVHGAPPSVTSLSPFGRFFAPAPSVTSLGPRGVFGSPFGGKFNFRDRFGRPFGFRRFPFRDRNSLGWSPYFVPFYLPYDALGGYGYPCDVSAGQAPVGVEPPPAGFGPCPSAGPPVEGRGEARPELREQASPAPVPAPPAEPPPPAAPQPTTVLVFRDGRTIEVRNYAIVGPTLFNLGERGPHRIAVADLNLPATVKINDDRGVEFALPR